MAQTKKIWHPKFLNYMEKIINHKNYKGLPITKSADGSYKWIAPANSEIGKNRIKWCINKAQEIGLITNPKEVYPGMYADVMLAIHPTKSKVCQICGKEMSLFYHYPNATFLKTLNKQFKTNFSGNDHIADIFDSLIAKGTAKTDVASFLIRKGGLNLSAEKATKQELIDALEYACRKQGKKCLGPGAMSNFPDRYDGFHTYNRCCRAAQDKGRSKENLKSYGKDRRAYEYLSDGNIHAANQFMHSAFFDNTSADHIGPISLGFIHDPRYLQKMSSNDNSSKRDRLSFDDINKIIDIAKKTNICPISWQSMLIWEFIIKNYESSPAKIPTIYRDALKQNMSNYMYILLRILEKCPKNGEAFIVKNLLEPHYSDFEFSYGFNEVGEIISKKPRHYTGRNQDEVLRYKRIAIKSIYEYNDKENRNAKPDLTAEELEKLETLCIKIEEAKDVTVCTDDFRKLIKDIEIRIIGTLE